MIEISIYGHNEVITQMNLNNLKKNIIQKGDNISKYPSYEEQKKISTDSWTQNNTN